MRLAKSLSAEHEVLVSLNRSFGRQGLTSKMLCNGWCAMWALEARKRLHEARWAISKETAHVGICLNGIFYDARHTAGARDVDFWPIDTSAKELAFCLTVTEPLACTGHDAYCWLKKNQPGLACYIPFYVREGDPECLLTMDNLRNLQELDLGGWVKEALKAAERNIAPSLQQPVPDID